MSSSESLFARAQQLIPGGVNSPVRAFRSVGGAPFFTKSAKGATLTTAHGKDLIDFLSPCCPAIPGHTHPPLCRRRRFPPPHTATAAAGAPLPPTPGKTSCVPLGPSLGTVGFTNPAAGYPQTVRKACPANGALLIFDEVMTGFRLARGGVQEIEGISPDLTCLGKIIGGGLPVRPFRGPAHIMDMLAPLGPGYQAGTPSGNPRAL